MTADAASPDTPTDPDVRLAKAQELAPLLLPSVVAVIAQSEMDAYGVDAFWDETYWRCRRCDLPSDENEWSDACVCEGWRWVVALLSLSGDSTREGTGSLRSEASGAPVKTPRLRRPGSPWTVRVHTWTDGEQTPTHSFSNRSVSADTEHHRGHLFPNAEFDELVVGRWLHVEQMDNSSWWMNIGGVTVHVTADRDGRPVRVDVDGPGDFDEPREGCEYSLTWTGTPAETGEVPRP